MNIQYMQIAIELSMEGMRKNAGGRFGAVVVKDSHIIGKAYNSVLLLNDPTAHAEVLAIRHACHAIGSYQLTGCELYTSCELCPMCLGAIYWARPDKVYFANTRIDAASIQFDDLFIYDELTKNLHERTIVFEHIPMKEAFAAFEEWKNKTDRKMY